MGLRLIAGVPFGRQMEPARNAVTMGMMLVYAMAVAIGVGIQYVLFRSALAVVIVTIIVGAGAWLLTRVTLRNFATRMRSSLKPDTSGSMFRYAYTDSE